MIDILNKNNDIDNIIINQFMGLGDILFSIPIAKSLHDVGYNIIWPVDKAFLNIQKNFEWIKFIDKDTYHIEYDNDCALVNDRDFILPLRYANNLISNGLTINCMSDKYKLVNLPLDKWRTLEWKRDIEKENKLYYDILKLSDNDEYNLINESFSMFRKININSNNTFKNIKFDIIEDFSILDWYKVIENAKNIYTVGTSVVFIIEVIPTNKLVDYFLYARRPDELNCDNYNYLLKKPTKEF